MDLFGRLSKKADAAPATGANVVEGSTATFNQDVIDASRDALVLVDFWADWCGPCKQLTPVLESVVESYGGTVKLVKINVDQNQALAAQLRIQSLPTVYAFKDGRPLDGFMGAQPESAIRDFITRCGAADAETVGLEDALAVGKQALEAGSLQDAATVFAQVLEQDQQNPGALAGLATCYLKSGDHARAEQTLALVPPDKTAEPDVAAARAAIDLAKQAENAGPISELEAKVAQAPDDHAARIELALAAAAAGDKTKAVDALIESFRRDRTWNDEAARKQLLQFFEAWGPTDKATIHGRRRLSSLMFS